jgi:hypothetical protein
VEVLLLEAVAAEEEAEGRHHQEGAAEVEAAVAVVVPPRNLEVVEAQRVEEVPELEQAAPAVRKAVQARELKEEAAVLVLVEQVCALEGVQVRELEEAGVPRVPN